MIVVIQCAASKHPAGSFHTGDGRRVAFVANPALAQPSVDTLWTHPDDLSDDGVLSWRQRLSAEQQHGGQNAWGLRSAAALYRNPAYAHLVDRFGANRVYILSAGWGLVRSDYLLPSYDITFSTAATATSARRLSDPGFLDFALPSGLPPDDMVFLGGKAYHALFQRLTAGHRGRRRVFYNSHIMPVLPGCDMERFVTRQRSIWYYRAAKMLEPES